MGKLLKKLTRLLPWRPNPILGTLLICVIGMQILIVLRMEKEKPMLLDGTANYLYESRRHLQETSADALIKDSLYDTKNCTCGLHFRVDAKEAEVFPVPAFNTTKFLSIGIPTVKRQNKNYINNTVTSLLSNMGEDEKNQTIIIILVADLDPAARNATYAELHQNFEEPINAGQIHVIEAPEALYSNFQVTKLTYYQSQGYVTWRSKQNYDYAFLMRYAAPMSRYYLQLEDDVIAAKNYVTKIKQYIMEQTEPWTCLEFSELGFIGKLYRSTDLERLSQLLLMFFQEQPGDYTYLYFNMLMTQLQKRMRTPTLFQHQGTQSSLAGKIQPLKDRFYDAMEKKYKGDNPPAEIFTTMKTYMNFVAKLPYSHVEGYFWSHGAPTAGDSFVVVFEEPRTLTRVVVETGSESHPEDLLQHGRLLASLTLVKTSDRLDCTNDIDLGEFREGKIDVTDVGSRVPFKVMCLQIKVLREQTPWMIIREIAVFLSPTTQA